MKNGINARLLVAILALALLVFGAASGHAQTLPRNETLYKAGMQWGPPTNFNPYNPDPAWPVLEEQLIYERLFAYDLLSGELDPILATGYVWVDDLTIEVTLRGEARFHDGTPVTVDDVVFSYELGRRNSLPFSPVWDYLEAVEAVDSSRVRFKLNPERAHKDLVRHYLTDVDIVPKHIWEKIEAEGNLRSYANTDPVGSGPYRLRSYTPEQIVVQRYEDYWGKDLFGTPAPKYIVHAVFKSNDAANLALQRGQVDWSQTFVPQIWKMWEDQGQPVGTWYRDEPYHIPASIPSLHINIHKKPLDNPLVRRALAYAINYELIAQTAMSRYSPTAQSSLIIPVGVPEQRFFDPERVAEYGWEFNPQKAIDILENELGATKGRDGIYVLPDGTRLGPFTVQCPYGWTDWMTALEVVAQSAQAIGIDVRTEFPEAPVWLDRRNTGNFDLLLDTPAGGYTPAHPWMRFRHVLDIRGVPPVGEVAYRNYNRYENPKVAELLDQAAAASDEAELARIYGELDRIFMQDIPIIPLMYRPWQFYEFNESYWEGFPTADNPTVAPLHLHTGVKIYYQLKPVR